MKVSNAAQGAYTYIPELATVPGRTYRINYTADLNGQGTVNSYARDVATSANLAVQGVFNGYQSYEFTATGTRTRIAFENTATAARTFYLDNFFVYEKNGATHYDAVVLMTADYYAFGRQMPGRNSNADSYRYGFNGMEKDDEIKGDGGTNDHLFIRINTRLICNQERKY